MEVGGLTGCKGPKGERRARASFKPVRLNGSLSGSGFGWGTEYEIREIVNGHLGAITVESCREHDTVFSITLPKRAGIEAPGRPRPHSAFARGGPL
jgi:hypothetical protein